MTTEQTSANGAQSAAQTTASSPTQTGAANPGSTEAKFTQADVDRILKDKLEKAPEREARVKADLLKQLGLAEDADFNTLKTVIEDARKRKEADMTESEKAKAELEREKKAKEDALIQLNAERQERRNDRIASALTSAAGKLKANDTDDVLRYARDKHGDDLAALIDDSGTVDSKKVDTLIEKIKASKPHYFTPMQTPGSQSNADGRYVPSDAEAMKRASRTNQRIIRGR